MRVALYARVSTSDKDQNAENQLVLLRREAEEKALRQNQRLEASQRRLREITECT